jgi:hypothetical protein
MEKAERFITFRRVDLIRYGLSAARPKGAALKPSVIAAEYRSPALAGRCKCHGICEMAAGAFLSSFTKNK